MVLKKLLMFNCTTTPCVTSYLQQHSYQKSACTFGKINERCNKVIKEMRLSSNNPKNTLKICESPDLIFNEPICMLNNTRSI